MSEGSRTGEDVDVMKGGGMKDFSRVTSVGPRKRFCLSHTTNPPTPASPSGSEKAQETGNATPRSTGRCCTEGGVHQSGQCSHRQVFGDREEKGGRSSRHGSGFRRTGNDAGWRTQASENFMSHTIAQLNKQEGCRSTLARPCRLLSRRSSP